MLILLFPNVMYIEICTQTFSGFPGKTMCVIYRHVGAIEITKTWTSLALLCTVSVDIFSLYATTKRTLKPESMHVQPTKHINKQDT